MSNEDEINELKQIIEEERQQREAKKEEQRRKNRERFRTYSPEQRAAWREQAKERMTDKDREAQRKYNADRQRAYIRAKTPLMTEEEKRKRNAMTTEYARRKRARLAGRPKPETCEVCGRGGNIVFEHSHTTGRFRGWTCDRCNVALAMVNDDIVVLEKLIVYLKAHDVQ